MGVCEPAVPGARKLTLAETQLPDTTCSGGTVYIFIDFSFLLKEKKSPFSSKRRRGFLKSSERYLMLKMTLLISPSLS